MGVNSMPKLSKEVRKAMDKAKKKVLKEASKPKPKPKKKPVKVTPSEPKNPSGRWIRDEWGEQGEIYFDGKLYWLTMFRAGKESGTAEAYPCALSEEKWEEYKKHPIRTNLEKFLGKSKKTKRKKRKSETSGTAEQLSSTQQKMKSTKSLKTRQKKSSPTKSGKTATRKKQG